jgi:diphthine synthase
MTANEGLKLLFEMEKKHKKKLILEETIACVVARAGSNKATIKSDTIKNLINFDFKETLHTIVIPGDLHFMEINSLKILAQLPAQQVRKLQKV